MAPGRHAEGRLHVAPERLRPGLPRGHRRHGAGRALRALRLALRGAGDGDARALPAAEVRGGAAHAQLPADQAGRGAGPEPGVSGDGRAVQAPGGHPAPGGALHRADHDRARAGGPAARGAGLRRLADRRGHEAGDRRLQPGAQGRRADAQPRAVPGGRHAQPRRGDRRDPRGRLHPQLLHQLLPPGAHRRALHGIRHPRKGWDVVARETARLADPTLRAEVEARLGRIKAGERDLYF